MNKRGQASVEAVLIIVIFTSMAIWVSNQFKEKGYFASLVEGPWSYIDGMAQYGVWGPAKRVKVLNPYTSRRISLEVENER